MIRSFVRIKRFMGSLAVKAGTLVNACKYYAASNEIISS